MYIISLLDFTSLSNSKFPIHNFILFTIVLYDRAIFSDGGAILLSCWDYPWLAWVGTEEWMAGCCNLSYNEFFAFLSVSQSV